MEKEKVVSEVQTNKEQKKPISSLEDYLAEEVDYDFIEDYTDFLVKSDD